MGLGGVAIAILPSIICLKLTFSDGLGGGKTVTADGFSAVAAMVPTGIAVRAIANKPIFGLISILMLC